MAKYPLTGFRFRVTFSGFTAEVDQAFQEVSGIGMDLDTEPLPRGGDPASDALLPLKVTHPKLVLKRGLFPGSELSRWVRDALEDFSFTPRLLTISLLDEEGNPQMTWWAAKAWPLGWSLSPFDATKSDVVMETIIVAYDSLRFCH